MNVAVEYRVINTNRPNKNVIAFYGTIKAHMPVTHWISHQKILHMHFQSMYCLCMGGQLKNHVNTLKPQTSI